MDGIGVVADVVLTRKHMPDQMVVHVLFDDPFVAMDAFLWPFRAFTHMLFVGVDRCVARTMDALALAVLFQKMFLFFLNGDILGTTKTLETLGAFGDMIHFFMCMIIEPTVPTGYDPVRTFGLDMMVQLILTALEMTALILMEAMVILFTIMGHHEEILLIGTQRT